MAKNTPAEIQETDSESDQEETEAVKNKPTSHELRKETLQLVEEWVKRSKDDPHSPIIATTGKSGVGKSTLINNFLELEGENKCPIGDGPDPTTVDVKMLTNVKFNDMESKITITLVDTPGLGDIDKKMKIVLQELSKVAQEKADILLYCASLHPTSRLNATDVDIIKTFTKAYGSEIWKHTILVLTFANADNRTHESEQGYRELIKGYAARFEKVLRQAKIKDIEVKSILSEKVDIGTIPAIPVGNDPSGIDVEFIENWSDMLLQEILNRSNPKVAIQLLKWKNLLPRESLEAATELVGTITATAVSGAAIGAAVGIPLAIIGVVGGAGIGMTAGAAIGGVTWFSKHFGPDIVKKLRSKQEEKQNTRSGVKTTGSTDEDTTNKVEDKEQDNE